MYTRKHMEEKNNLNEEIISHSNHINLILKSLKFPILFYSDSEFFLTGKMRGGSLASLEARVC